MAYLTTKYLSLDEFKEFWGITDKSADGNITRCLVIIEGIIDAVTNEKITNFGGFTELTEFQKARVKACMVHGCQFYMVAQGLNATGLDTSAVGSKSITLGDLTITNAQIDEVSRTLSDKTVSYPISSIGFVAYNELVRSGLADRRIH